MSKYIFPFNTCETPNKKGIVQPYSALVNIITCLIILFFLLKTKQTHTSILLFSILCFELFHLFSHIIHIHGSMQINVTHMLTCFMNLAFFYVYYCHTKNLPNNKFLLFIFILVCFDIYAFKNLNIVYYMLSQSLIFISLLCYYYSSLPILIQNNIYRLIVPICIIILLVLNEKYNCDKMLAINPKFPYHIFIEIVGLFLFYIISSTFYKL
jgi:hypothetical protein